MKKIKGKVLIKKYTGDSVRVDLIPDEDSVPIGNGTNLYFPFAGPFTEGEFEITLLEGNEPKPVEEKKKGK